MTQTAIDPVCGRSVKTTAAQFTAGSGTATRYFCSEHCRRRFSADAMLPPSRTDPKKGFWARYLHRLNKTTGGKPPSCCG
jgi:YHS domain-containing protein